MAAFSRPARKLTFQGKRDDENLDPMKLEVMTVVLLKNGLPMSNPSYSRLEKFNAFVDASNATVASLTLSKNLLISTYEY